MNNDGNTINKELTKTKKNTQTHLSINKEDLYINELISRINIINEELYDYIIFECGYKNTSKEFKKEVRTYLDKVMVNYLNDIK